MDKIKAQANTVSQLLFSSETGATYKKAFVLTWDILRETGILLWLIICLVFVGGEWFYHNSVKLGRKTRFWYDHLGQKETQPESASTTSTGQAILNAGQSGVSYLLTQARQQLGIKEPDRSLPTAQQQAESQPAAKADTQPPTSAHPTVTDTTASNTTAPKPADTAVKSESESSQKTDLEP